jgi:hypothetical protein
MNIHSILEIDQKIVELELRKQDMNSRSKDHGPQTGIENSNVGSL